MGARGIREGTVPSKAHPARPLLSSPTKRAQTTTMSCSFTCNIIETVPRAAHAVSNRRPARGSGRCVKQMVLHFRFIEWLVPTSCAPWAVAPVPFGCNASPHIGTCLSLCCMWVPTPGCVRPSTGRGPGACGGTLARTLGVFLCVPAPCRRGSPTPPTPHALPARRGPSCALELQSVLHLSAIVLRYCPPGRSGV